ncbi:MAG: hypothetical protein M3342_19260 [Bacteroidota bacterium]|nr:hypothetical protein [Bacteroidota bacterium]
MKEYTNQLIELKASVPEQYSEENLQNLEKIVTQYHQIMLSIAEMEDEDNKTQYHLERIDALEDYLRNAKYGTSERQRASSFAYAKEILFEGIQALLNIIGETN